MYSYCLSCTSSLKSNDSLERLPIGRRVAYDHVKGRVWVLCGTCRTWNLVPLAERWEIVEDAERLFEKASLGASTTNVALGRLPDGLELLRIGRVERPEFAGWRYGDRIVRRRQLWNRELRSVSPRSAVLVGAAVGGGLLGVPWAAIVVPAGLAASLGYDLLSTLRDARRPLVRLEGMTLTKYQASLVRIAPSPDSGWHLIVRTRRKELAVYGAEAVRLLRSAMPQIHQFGSPAAEVSRAVAVVEEAGSSDEVLRRAARQLMDQRAPFSGGRVGYLNIAPAALKTAVEIAANEEAEANALRGDLRVLEEEWRQAEELAAISDNLLIPREFEKWIADARSRQLGARIKHRGGT